MKAANYGHYADHRYLSRVHEDHEGGPLTILKGGPSDHVQAYNLSQA